MLLAITPADPDTVDNITLLGLVSQPAGLVWARGARNPVDNVQLTVLPASGRRAFVEFVVPSSIYRSGVPDPKEESEDIRLFLLVEFTDVLVRTHSCEVPCRDA